MLLAEDHRSLSSPCRAVPQRPLYAQPQRLEEGASSPSSAATGNAEPGGQGPGSSSSRGGQAAQRWGLHHCGKEGREAEPRKGAGEGQSFPVYVTTRPPRKGKDLESSLLLGRLQLASVYGSQPWDRIPGAGHDSFPGEVGIQQPEGLGLCSWGLRRAGLAGRLLLASWEVRHGAYTPGFDSSHSCLWLWLMLVSVGWSKG